MGEVLQGVVDVLETEGYGLLLFTCNRGEESMRQFASQVSASSFDGLLVIEPEGTMDYIEELHTRGLPVVLIDDRGHQPLFPSVATTNRNGGAAAARHLLDLGRSRPLVITGPERFGCCQERQAGFAQTFAEAGLPLDPALVVVGDFTFDYGQTAVKQALESGAQFDAVFAHNDLSAAGALQVLRECGYLVPDQVAVVGFDDIPLAAHTDPPLTTVHQPMRRMGEAAAGLLIAHLGGTPLPEAPTIIDTSLIIRGSSVAAGPPRTDAAPRKRATAPAPA